VTNRRQSVGRGLEEGGSLATGSLGVAPRATERTGKDRVGGGTSVALGSAWPGRVDCPCPGLANTAEIDVPAVRVVLITLVQLPVY